MHLLTYFRRKSESKDGSDEAAGGVELSVRQARPGQELRALPQSASKTRKTAWLPDDRQDSKRSTSGLYDPLQAQGSSALPVTAASSLAPDALLSRVNSKQWLRQSCSSTRLVLSTLLEMAAVNSPQQQHLQQQLQCVIDSVSWEAACKHCMDAITIRALLGHYCPGVQLAPGDDWEQLQHSCPMQEHPAACLPAHLVSTLAAAAHSCEGSGRDSSGAQGILHLVTHAIVVGELLQLQQQQDTWGRLLQLSGQPQATQQPQQLQQPQDAEQQQQDALPDLQQMLQAWVAAVISAAAGSAQQHSVQQHPPQWAELLRVLSGLQQQVQGPSHEVQDPLKNPAAVTPSEALLCAERGDAGGSSQLGSSVQQLQRRHALVQNLCRTVPVLLQPADLAATAPDSMQLVVLARLAAATSSLWSPLLDAAGLHPAVQEAAAEPAAAAATRASSEGRSVLGAGGSAAVSALQLKPDTQLGLAARQDAAVAIWQGTAAEQVAAELAGGPYGSNGTVSASEGGLSSSLKSPRSSWPDELLSPSPQLWPGDVESEDDAAAITREERTLRCWINSLLHRHAHSTHTAAAAAGQQGQLLQTFSLDGRLGGGSSSSMYAGHVLSRPGPDAGTPPPVRAQSVGGGRQATGAPLLSPLQLSGRSSSQPGSSSSGGGVFRSSSAGAAAVAAHLNAAAPCSEAAAHSRSISADAVGGAVAVDVDVSLDGWAGEPAAPTTPTAAAAAAAAAGASGSSRAAAAPAISSISSLFGAELRSGVLLLQLLDLLQPGSIDWRAVNKPPFVSRTAQLKALENCQLALKVAQEELGLPLVSMSPRDIVLGRRKIILSLVYQLMRYNTMQLLESISAVQTEQQLGGSSRRSSTGGDSEPSTPVAAAQSEAAAAAGKWRPIQQQQLSLPPTGLQAARHSGGRVNIRSSSKKHRRQLAITEQDILDWANTKLQQVKPLAGSDVGAEAPRVRSFKDPVLGSGVVLLQLLHVLAPDLVEPAYVTPGHSAEQRQSNAKYALSLADRMGCSLFLVWEDLVDPPQPRMVLVLLASLMAQDLQRQQQGAYATV